MKYTHKAPFDKGYNGMVSAVEHPEMMGMEFGVVKMAAGDVMHFDYAQEVVYDLMSGSVTFAWNGNSETVTRKDVFHEGAILLHVPQNTRPSLPRVTRRLQYPARKTSAISRLVCCVRRTACARMRSAAPVR